MRGLLPLATAVITLAGLMSLAQTASADPVIRGSLEVITTEVVRVGDRTFALNGIDAPHPGQACRDEQAEVYDCGRAMRDRFKRAWDGKPVTCLLEQGQHRTAAHLYITGTCYHGGTNVNAAVVRNGWAIADRDTSRRYVVYERDAKASRNGLWAGTFFAPKLYERKVGVIKGVME